MNKIVVSKDVLNVITQIGLAYNQTIKKVGLQTAAKRTVERYESKKLNTSYTRFISENISDIEAIARGEKAKYKIATIYKDADTDQMEIEEGNQ